MGYLTLLQQVQDGQPVDAATVNGPTGTLDQRTQYLYEVLQAARIGSTVYARSVAIDPDANIGMPVFWDREAQRFGLGLAAVILDQASGMVKTADSTSIWGIVHRKLAANVADVLLFGFAPCDITTALDSGETVQAGTYYLSRQTPGHLTQLKPPIAIPVLKTDGAGNVFVAPQWQDLLTAHTHLRFRLRAIPAGLTTPPAEGHVHTITDPDPSIEGWLPASHAVFGGKAPARAMFGYNLGANRELSNAWPPLPASDATLVQNGVEVDQGPEGLCLIDSNGIWWCSDCYGQVPWPVSFNETLAQLSGYSESASMSGACYDHAPWLDLFFTRYGFLTEQTVVTSLTTQDPRIQIGCVGGGAAATGNLQLALNLAYLVTPTGDWGTQAIKSFNPTGQTFQTGPVVSGLYPLSDNVHLTSQATATVTIGDVPVTVSYGQIGITVDNPYDQELSVQLVRLDGVLEEYDQDVPYLGFPASLNTSFRGRISVPESLALVGPQMALQFRVLGLVPGTLPTFTLTVRRVPAAASLTTLPTSDTSVTLTIAGITIATALQYIDVLSAPFTIAPGDDVLYTLSRPGSSGDAYTGEVGIMRQMGIVTGAD